MTKLYMEITVQKIKDTVCVVAFDPRHYDPVQDLKHILEFAVSAVDRRGEEYFSQSSTELVVESSKTLLLGREPDCVDEVMPPPSDWRTRVMLKIMSEYRDPIDYVFAEMRAGLWRRVATVGGIKAVLDGPGFDVDEFVNEHGELELGDHMSGRFSTPENLARARAEVTERLVTAFHNSFPGGPWSALETRNRFMSALGLLP